MSVRNGFHRLNAPTMASAWRSSMPALRNCRPTGAATRNSALRSVCLAKVPSIRIPEIFSRSGLSTSQIYYEVCIEHVNRRLHSSGTNPKKSQTRPAPVASWRRQDRPDSLTPSCSPDVGKPPARTVGSKRDTSPSLSGQRRLGVVALLVRAKHNRSLGRQTPNLFDTAQTQPVRERLEIHVARTSASRGARRQKAHGKREARKAVVELRWFAVELPPPETSGFRNEAPNWFASAGASMTGIMS